jgi:hypothetical protein
VAGERFLLPTVLSIYQTAPSTPPHETPAGFVVTLSILSISKMIVSYSDLDRVTTLLCFLALPPGSDHVITSPLLAILSNRHHRPESCTRMFAEYSDNFAEAMGESMYYRYRVMVALAPLWNPIRRALSTGRYKKAYNISTG